MSDLVAVLGVVQSALGLAGAVVGLRAAQLAARRHEGGRHYQRRRHGRHSG